MTTTQTAVNPFLSAKKKESASKKDDTPVFSIEGLAPELRKLKEAKAMIAQYEAQKKMAEGVIKEKGTAKFLDLVKTEGRRFTSFKITDDTDAAAPAILFGLQDRYSAVTEEAAHQINQEFPDTVETKTAYSFNAEILEKYFTEIGEALMNTSIPDDAKANLLEVVQTFVVKKGTIDKLPTYAERAPLLFQAIQPVAFLK